jgi:phenylalanyl-tRNA synthetase alpha chain
MQNLAEIQELLSKIDDSIIEDKTQLESFKNEWLGKKGLLAELYDLLKQLPNDEKKDFGKYIQQVKVAAELKFEKGNQLLQDRLITEKSAGLDLTLTGKVFNNGSLHPLTITRNEMVKVFSDIGFIISEGDEIVDDWHNFSALNMPENHPARDMQDTFFVSTDPNIVMRTHTSSVQVKVMQNQKPPTRTISPGSVYRKDSDSTHSPHFHQIEGLYVDKDVSFADLKKTLMHFVQCMFGKETKVRFRPSYFPFTEPSAEMDIWYVKQDPESGKTVERWMEILGCGMVDPQVLVNCGINPEEYSGFAFGIGIERIAMVKYSIPDIRLFFENDLRFLNQFKG